MLDRAVIDALFPADLPEPEHWERRYPPRSLSEGAQVTRFGPSPTGFVHIGGLYVATIDRDIATHSGGVYLVRVEDTDQTREVEGVLAQFARAFDYFHITPRQQAAKIPTGYYGQWAIWRDADAADVAAKLAEGVPYVVRFRAPDEA